MCIRDRANAYVPNPSSPGGVIGTPIDNPESKPAPPEAFTSMNGLGGATGGGPSMVNSEGTPVKPSDSAANISQSRKSYLRGMSGWTEQQKIDSQTPTDANSGAD